MVVGQFNQGHTLKAHLMHPFQHYSLTSKTSQQYLPMLRFETQHFPIPSNNHAADSCKGNNQPHKFINKQQAYQTRQNNKTTLTKQYT
jgi:hypothetical protein